MDNDTKLVMFLEMSGASDVDFAKSMLEAHGWDLDAAILTMTSGDSPAQPAARRPADGDGEIRSPMATGYTDTLIAPIDPAEVAARERRRREEEAQRQRQAEADRAAAEFRRRRSNEDTAVEQRKRAEEEAQKRRQQKRKEEMDERRLQADPEKWKVEQERRQQEVEAAAQRQQDEQERQRREAAKAEAQAKLVEEEGNLQARRREQKEQEDILREKAEAEARGREASAAAATKATPSGKDDLLLALSALRKKYKDTNAAGLAKCLKTLHTYISNLAKDPTEPKFQSINCQNAAFIARVGEYDGADAVLKAIGFVARGDGQMVIEPDFAKSKGPYMWDALAKIDVLIKEAETKAKAAA